MALRAGMELSAQALGFNFLLEFISEKEFSIKDMGGMAVAAKVEASRFSLMKS